jgi:murein DD-endopeptidase MepM/ murein hydrolase activator NlpD
LLNATVRARGALRHLRTDRITTPPAARALRDRGIALARRIVVRPAAARPFLRSGARLTTARIALGARLTTARIALGARLTTARIALRDRGIALARRIVMRPGAARPSLRSGAHRASRLDHLTDRLTAALGARTSALGVRLGGRDRFLPIGVALLILVGSLSSVAAAAPTGAVGGTQGVGQGARLAIAGLDSGIQPVDAGIGVDGQLVPAAGAARFGLPADAQAELASQPQGPYLADGTLLKPIAVNTIVADGADTLVRYRVRSGDTLTGIARHFGVSMMTLWWANHLTSKDDLKVGQPLVIPPVNGTVRVVKDGDTLEMIAAQAKVPAGDIVAFNGLTDTTLVIGQTLILPGAIGKPIPTPKPRPVVLSSIRSSSSGGGGRATVPRSYGGGNFAWPVPGGSISQYFHYSHPALDIQAPYGSRVIAAADGTVVFSGWNNNGGGYQVWIAHGSGLYTTYNHMSAITVGNGEHVSRGEQVGRIGTSGWATGPHLHFEVWRGEVWGNGYRVNPLSYL